MLGAGETPVIQVAGRSYRPPEPGALEPPLRLRSVCGPVDLVAVLAQTIPEFRAVTTHMGVEVGGKDGFKPLWSQLIVEPAQREGDLAVALIA